MWNKPKAYLQLITGFYLNHWKFCIKRKILKWKNGFLYCFTWKGIYKIFFLLREKICPPNDLRDTVNFLELFGRQAPASWSHCVWRGADLAAQGPTAPRLLCSFPTMIALFHALPVCWIFSSLKTEAVLFVCAPGSSALFSSLYLCSVSACGFPGRNVSSVHFSPGSCWEHRLQVEWALGWESTPPLTPSETSASCVLWGAQAPQLLYSF